VVREAVESAVASFWITFGREAEKLALAKRYGTLSMKPSKIEMIDRFNAASWLSATIRSAEQRPSRTTCVQPSEVHRRCAEIAVNVVWQQPDWTRGFQCN
jgi:hypothetical protein